MKIKIFIILLIILTSTFTVLIFLKSKAPTNHDLNFIRGFNAFSDNKYIHAIKFLKNDLIDNPGRSESQYKIAQSYILQEYQDINKAIEYYQIYLKNNNLNEIVNSKLINNIQYIGMTVELKLISDTIKNPILKAKILVKEHPEKAINYLKDIKEENKNQEFYEILAHANFSLHHFKETLQNIKNAEKLGSIETTLLYTKIQAQRMLHQFDEVKLSLQAYEKLNAISKSNNLVKNLDLINDLEHINGEINQDLKVLKIIYYLKTNQYSLAKVSISNLNISELTTNNRIKILETSINVKFDFIVDLIFSKLDAELTTEVESILFCKYFGQLYEPLKAINYCSQMNLKYPNLAPLYFWHGIALLKNNNLTESINQIQKAIDYAPWVNKWRIQLAEIYLTKGNVELAKEVVNSAIIDNDRQLSIFRNKYGLNR